MVSEARLKNHLLVPTSYKWLDDGEEVEMVSTKIQNSKNYYNVVSD